MSERLPNDVRRAFDALDVTYDADDLEHGVDRLRARARERRSRRVTGAALIAIAVIGAALFAARGPSTSDLTLADGTRCTPLDEQSRVTLVREDASVVLLRVERGTVRFAVAKQHGRRFEVEAGDVTVHVVGTVFDVERVGATARVAVSEGRVEVTTASVEAPAPVAAGESWSAAPPDGAPVMNGAPSTPAADTPSAPTTDAPATSAPAATHGRSASAASAPSSEAGKVAWRALARSGDYQRAFAALKSKDSEAPKDSSEDLFLAADSARLSGHPADAVPYLTAIMDKHAHDGRADLAAFTLGRIYLGDLDQPGMAARVFARARELAPHGELAEDALAREVESWKRAGALEKASDRARVYLDAYPKGQRVEHMRGLVIQP